MKYPGSTGGGTDAAPWPKSSPPPVAKLPARKWRDMIRQAWHTDPLECPKYGKEMRLIAVIENSIVIEKILRHTGLSCDPATFAPTRPPPPGVGVDAKPTFPSDDDGSPLPDYENVITD